MWARVEDGIVVELTDIDPAGRFHESLVWVPCSDGCKPGDKIENESTQEKVGEQEGDK